MERIIKIIKENTNIDNELKDKIIECASMIVDKFPIAYKNLLNNLDTITIRYMNEQDSERLKKVKADSAYDCHTNTLILNKEFVNSAHYKNLIIHELLHVASYDKVNNLGFESLYAKRGLSLNEGMTEYLTCMILNNYNFGMAIYVNDINNITLLSKIIPINELINLYFTEGLLGFFTKYINRVGMDNNLKKIIESMDDEFGMRVRNNVFNNQYKDKYITLLVDDISKLSFENDFEIIDVIKTINQFIKLQYKTDTIPLSIKSSIENSYNILFSKLGKGQNAR